MASFFAYLVLGIPAAAKNHDGREAEGQERPGGGLDVGHHQADDSGSNEGGKYADGVADYGGSCLHVMILY